MQTPRLVQLAIKEYEAIEVNNPGILDDLRADAAVAEAKMHSAYEEYVSCAAAAIVRGALTHDAPRCRIWRSDRRRRPLLQQQRLLFRLSQLRRLQSMTIGAPFLSRRSGHTTLSARRRCVACYHMTLYRPAAHAACLAFRPRCGTWAACPRMRWPRCCGSSRRSL